MIKVRRVPLYLHVVVLARFSQQTFFLTKIQKLKHHGDAPPPPSMGVCENQKRTVKLKLDNG